MASVIVRPLFRLCRYRAVRLELAATVRLTGNNKVRLADRVVVALGARRGVASSVVLDKLWIRLCRVAYGV